jgi:release factor glutamine methyltransferase
MIAGDMATDIDPRRLIADASRTLDRREAELLLSAALGLTRAQWLARDDLPVPADVAARFADLLAQRAAGVPVAYLLKRREFWSLDFEVDTNVLVPRPETELLVERVLARVPTTSAQVADLGTGAGIIAIALAVERPAWHLVGTDVSAAALAVAGRNGDRLAPGRVDWRLGTWFAPLAGEKFTAIASNPPYIAADDPALAGDGLLHEPRGALTPGGDGFAALATLINTAPGHLQPGGWLLLEHGNTQAPGARAALVARGFGHVTSHRDLAGHERVTEAQWSNR